MDIMKVGNQYIADLRQIERIRRLLLKKISAKEAAEDNDEKKAAWKLIKKVNRILWGSEKCKIIIEDPSGNSAIISDKAKKDKLKVKK